MAAYGADCAIEALRVPLMQIVPTRASTLSKRWKMFSRLQAARESPALAIDCDTGEVTDMMRAGVVDPLPVKKQALRRRSRRGDSAHRPDHKKRQEPEAAGE